MRNLCAVLLTFALAAGAAGQNAQTTDTNGTAAADAAAEHSRLVRAANEAKAKRKTSKTRVITNDDVKKATGKVTEMPRAPQTATAETAAKKPETPPAEKKDERTPAQRAADDRVAAAENRVHELESELNRIELSYNGRKHPPDKRALQIEQQLEPSRRALAEARRAAEAATPAAPAQPAKQ